MRLLFAVAILLTVTRTRAQNDTLRKEPAPDFKNAGEQEDYWAKELFENSYAKENFSRYTGKIVIVNDNTFGYGDNIIKVHSTSDELKTIFKLGIINSAIFGGGENVKKPSIDSMTIAERTIYGLIRSDTLAISDVEELKFLNTSSQVKRFRFLLWRPGFANPTLYFFELTNDKANKKTGLVNFIRGSQLTLIKMRSILI
ncbi:hypothetical protein Q4E93_21970 [Flavitalea sp. BT771]|uniref:hypothetical protein n=1 Tax=Flavitalea sp. BT771 TaxID=3063329 RepID=UPI0026E1CD90|nr:hypothetical protein [Flavitalea sp. BT771]MDO6433294.1 hypothetical protein [Flavitalea sp. BT771]MDV6222801.1 hypothetical protein [Flavitalea sp. BT771]